MHEMISSPEYTNTHEVSLESQFSADPTTQCQYRYCISCGKIRYRQSNMMRSSGSGIKVTSGCHPFRQTLEPARRRRNQILAGGQKREREGERQNTIPTHRRMIGAGFAQKRAPKGRKGGGRSGGSGSSNHQNPTHSHTGQNPEAPHIHPHTHCSLHPTADFRGAQCAHISSDTP